MADDLSTYWKDLPSRETPLDARTLNAWGGLVEEQVGAAEVAAQAASASAGFAQSAAQATDATVAGRILDTSSATSAAMYGATALSTSDNLGSLPRGIRSVWAGSTATALGLPTAIEGVVLTMRYGSIDQQMWLPATTVPQMWLRTKRASGWTAWTRVDAGAVAAPEAPVVPPASAPKRVPLALTATSGGTTTTTTSAGAVRFPLRFAATIPRFRLHVSNRNERANSLRAGAASLTGIWLGARSGSTGAFAAAPAALHGPVTLPADGSEWVSPWLPGSITKNVDHLLSVGFTTAGQASVLSTGGAYLHAASTEGPTVSAAGFAQATSVPLSWWIEAEVPGAVPVIAGFGDSNTVGTGTSLPIFDSWLSQHARTVGGLPVHHAYPGTSMAEWRSAAWLWTRWDGYAKADAVVVALGQNDLSAGITLAEMQARLADMAPKLLTHVAPVIHLATITPTSTKTADINAVRQAYNTWLASLPQSARDHFDFAAAVDDGTGTALAPGLRHSDNLHMVTAGHTAMAGAVLRAPALAPWAA